MPTSELARDRRADDDRVRLESRVLLDFASVSSRVAALLPLPQGMEAYRPRPVFGTTSAHWRPPIVRRPQEPTTSTPDLEGVQWYDPRTTHAESTQPSPCLQRPRSARLSRRRVILAALRRARHRRSNLGRTETCGPHGTKKAEGRRCRPLRTVYGIGPQVSSSCRRPFQAPRCAPISVVFHVSASDAVAHLRACRGLSVPLSPLRSIAAPANRYALLALDDAVSCETRMRHSLRCHRDALACPRVVRPCTRPTMRRATRSPAECSSRTLRGACKAHVCACHSAVGCSADAGGAVH